MTKQQSVSASVLSARVEHVETGKVEVATVTPWGSPSVDGVSSMEPVEWLVVEDDWPVVERHAQMLASDWAASQSF